MGAIGLLTNERNLHSACPILVSGSCKQETGEDHAKMISIALKAAADTGMRTLSIDSDGEARRGEAIVRITFKRPLSEDSPLYPILGQLRFMNLEVGDDDITGNKDYKHIFKRYRNTMLRENGIVVLGVHIRHSAIRVHLSRNRVPTHRIDNLLKPNDRQDVKLSYDLLHEIWSLKDSPLDNANPSFLEAHRILCKMGQLYQYLLLPYICIDMSLSEQLTYLSGGAHMLLALWVGNKQHNSRCSDFISSQLYIDSMIMIKNVYFCVAKIQVDTPNGKCWIISFGTDRLELVFADARTCIGNDANMDILQLADCLTGGEEIATIRAKMPQWDVIAQRLRLPALSKDDLTVHAKVDHITPSTWRGDVSVAKVSPLTCWRLGRSMMEDEFPELKSILDNLPETVDILQPFSIDMVKRPPPDVDDSIDPIDNRDAEPGGLEMFWEEAMAMTEDTSAVETTFDLDGKQVYKESYLKTVSAHLRTSPDSVDRLKRVQSVARYAIRSDDYVVSPEIVSGGSEDTLNIHAPIATLIRSDNHLFLAFGEVLDIVYQQKHHESLPILKLTDPTSTITFQLLCLRPTTTNDTSSDHDWVWSLERGSSFSIPARMVQPIDPDISVHTAGEPTYIFESPVLRSLGASLLEAFDTEDGSFIPDVEPSQKFPYKEGGGRDCFVCEADGKERQILDSTTQKCTHCTPPVTLPAAGPRIIEHVAAHILFDPNVNVDSEPCGLCLRPYSTCEWRLNRAGNQVEWKKSK